MFLNKLNRWYREGVYTIPPPCFYSRTFRKYFSNNSFGGPISCMNVAQWGNEWGTKNRSYIMFVAFWVSILGFLLLIIPFLALSRNPEVIKFAHWIKTTQENIPIYDLNTNTTFYEEVNLYAGTFLLVRSCSDDNNFCDQSSLWTDKSTCSYSNQDDSYCSKCAKICIGTFSTAFMGLISMIPQILTNLQRSTEAGDLNCQKYVGQFSALVGFCSTLVAILQFYFGCYLKILDSLDRKGNTVSVDIGAAFICVLIATILKPFDFWAHWVIPVPSKHWDPDHREYFDEKHRKIQLNLSEDEESGLIFANQPIESFKNKTSLYNSNAQQYRNNNHNKSQIYINNDDTIETNISNSANNAPTSNDDDNNNNNNNNNTIETNISKSIQALVVEQNQSNSYHPENNFD